MRRSFANDQSESRRYNEPASNLPHHGTCPPESVRLHVCHLHTCTAPGTDAHVDPTYVNKNRASRRQTRYLVIFATLLALCPPYKGIYFYEDSPYALFSIRSGTKMTIETAYNLSRVKVNCYHFFQRAASRNCVCQTQICLIFRMVQWYR